MPAQAGGEQGVVLADVLLPLRAEYETPIVSMPAPSDQLGERGEPVAARVSATISLRVGALPVDDRGATNAPMSPARRERGEGPEQPARGEHRREQADAAATSANHEGEARTSRLRAYRSWL